MKTKYYGCARARKWPDQSYPAFELTLVSDDFFHHTDAVRQDNCKQGAK